MSFGSVALVTVGLCILQARLAVSLHTTVRTDRHCGGLLITAPGTITSHEAYGSHVYGRNLECLWQILSPPGYRVRLYPVTLSVESGPKCSFDHLHIFDDSKPGNGSLLLGTLCGSKVDKYFVSTGHSMAIRFRTDRSVNKAGFVLRFVFEEQSDEIPGGIVTSRNQPCGDEQIPCKSGLCIPDSVLCDGVNDCTDSTDEKGCPATVPKPCPYGQASCDAKQCIPTNKICDGRIDCVSEEDEKNCQKNETVTLIRGQVDCGKPKVQHRIVGGKVAKVASWPWTVSLRLNNYHVCGGSIVADKWIVTAAHCVEGYLDPGKWQIHAGRHKVDGNAASIQKRRVSRIIVHPRWSSKTIDYDFTLMKLAKPLKWTKHVLPICLPKAFLKTGSKCYIAGWGDTKGTGGDGRLKQGLVKTFSRKQCNRWYGGGITSRMLCAGRKAGGVDSCQGDSGGPLMCKTKGAWVLHGATSFGGECGAPNSPGVYAKVAKVRTWISKRVQSPGSSSGGNC